jgi:hypothetical protein
MPEKLPTYAECVRTLGPARQQVIDQFKALGGDRNRWQAQDRDAMAIAITIAEDHVEYLRDCPARQRHRKDMKTVRRRLELSISDEILEKIPKIRVDAPFSAKGGGVRIHNV